MMESRNHGRVNTKLLIVLAAVVGLVAIAVGGIWAVGNRTSVEDRVRMGDEMMAQGNPVGAISQYGLALNDSKDSITSTPEYIGIAQKYIEAVKSAPATDILQARKYLNQLQEWPRRIADQNPDNQQLLEDYYKLLVELAENLDGPSFYRQLRDVTNAKLQRDPDNIVAKRYRGAAQMQQISPDLSLELIQQTHDDLEAAAEKWPDDPEIQYDLARWYLFEADRLRRTAAPENRIKPLLDKAVQIVSASLQKDPDDVQRQLNYLNILLDQQIDKREEATQMLARLEASLVQTDMKDHIVLDAVQALATLDREPVTVNVNGVDYKTTRGIMRAEALLKQAVEKQPDEKIYLLALGRLARQQGKIEEAIASFQRVRDIADQGNAIEMLRDNDLQVEAAYDTANLLLAKLDSVKDKDERQEITDEIQSIISELQRKVNNDSKVVNALAGKLLLAERKLPEALIRLDRASRQFGDANPELLLLTAKICRQLGETGEAMKRLEDLMKLRPDLIGAQVELAELQLRNRQYSQAESELSRVLARDPENRDALQLKAMLQAVRGELQDAIDIYYKLYNEKQDPRLLRAMVPLLVRLDRAHDAQDLAQAEFDKNPDNLEVMILLLRLTDDAQQREAILQKSLDAGGDARTIAQIKQRMENPTPMNAEDLIPLIDDPVTQWIARSELAWRNGNMAEAKKYLAEAVKTDPDDSRVLELQFNIAVGEQDWTTARRVVEQASTRNVDMAGGAFWRGRLDAAQGKLIQAIADYRQGLSSRPIYSEGHRMLGDLLLQTNSFAEAIEQYNQALMQKPDDVNAVRGLADAYDKRGEYDKALDAIRRAVQIDPTNEQLINLYISYEEQHGNVDRALELRRQLRQLAPKNYANRRRLAIGYAQIKRYDDAFAEVQDLLKEEGQTRANVATLAQIDSIAGKPQDGLDAIRNYINSLGDQAQADDIVLMARFLLTNGMSDQAVDWYERAIKKEDPTLRQVSRELADVAFSSGRYAEALKLYQPILESKPDDESVKLRLTETLVKLNRFDEATKLLATVKQDNATIAVLKALIAEGRGDTDAATKMLDNAITRWPTDSMLYYQRARLQAQQPGGILPAMKDLDEALRLNPSGVESRQLLIRLHLQKGEVKDAVRELRALLTRQPGATDVRLQLFNLYLNRGDYLAAAGLVEDAMQKFPGDPTWPRERARVAELQKDLPKQRESWERAVMIAPSPANIASLADVMLRAGAPNDALKLLRDHADQVNQQPLLQALRGRAMAEMNRKEEARNVLLVAADQCTSLTQFDLVIQQIQKALGDKETINLIQNDLKDISDTWKQLILARMELTANQYNVAVERLEKLESSISKDPTEERMFERMMSVSLHQTKDYAKARDYYERLIKTDPQDVTSMNNLAFLLAKENLDRERALVLAQRAAQIVPDSAEILDTLGFIQLELDRLEEARESLLRSYSIRPMPANALHLGVVQAKLGNRMEAADLLKQAVTLAGEAGDAETKVEAQKMLDALQK